MSVDNPPDEDIESMPGSVMMQQEAAAFTTLTKNKLPLQIKFQRARVIHDDNNVNASVIRQSSTHKNSQHKPIKDSLMIDSMKVSTI